MRTFLLAVALAITGCYIEDEPQVVYPAELDGVNVYLYDGVYWAYYGGYWHNSYDRYSWTLVRNPPHWTRGGIHNYYHGTINRGVIIRDHRHR